MILRRMWEGAVKCALRFFRRDEDTLAALRNGFGHQDFGVAGVVVQSGVVALGDEAKVL